MAAGRRAPQRVARHRNRAGFAGCATTRGRESARYVRRPSERKNPSASAHHGESSDGWVSIEKLIFESLPGVYVSALVYVPEDGNDKHPAILVPAGHAANGKIHYQGLCQRLVQRGYVVIAWDPVGQGERSQFWDAKAGKSRYNLICAEHAVMGNLAYLAGDESGEMGNLGRHSRRRLSFDAARSRSRAHQHHRHERRWISGDAHRRPGSAH